jgi:hypothetical protein
MPQGGHPNGVKHEREKGSAAMPKGMRPKISNIMKRGINTHTGYK